MPGRIIVNDMVLSMNLLLLIPPHRTDLVNVQFVQQWMMSGLYFGILGWDTHTGQKLLCTQLKLEILSSLVVILQRFHSSRSPVRSKMCLTFTCLVQNAGPKY